MGDRLAGKVAVITGTASGQGAVAARLFADEGAVVEGCDVAPGDVAPGDGWATVDLTDEASVRAWLDDVGERHGRIDVLYLNAGATRFSPVEETALEDWRFVLAHELDVVFLPAKHAWRWLQRSAGASVVLIGSTAGVTGSMTNARLAHTVTKGGVVAATKQLAAEGAPHGIRVNCVSPGMIRTPATEGDLLAADHPMRTIAAHIPIGRVGDAAEVVRAALFLASDEASYITGANLMVDGGWSAVLPGGWTANP
jgi:meso-butanediol dehydrogenase / (S,S)-butanediol dehydrogenase / diacetyl reductase